MAFQVDAILGSVSELEKEKAGKDVILTELTSQRLKLQNELQNVRDKHSKVAVRHTQSEENLKLNEQKSLELDGLVNNYERINENKRSSVNKLTEEMETDSSIVQDEQNSCEDTLTELTGRFRSAISFYGCTSLNDQLEDNNELKENLKLKFAERLVKLADLKEKLSNDGTTVSDDLNIIDEESQALTL
ncbi:PREDICTED: uncharacterized protein LOC109585195 [Amphimedon queenslandica]|nr:PREDICTED: uncharacterized protein LOC109585195 [Amphimedon queenslandica]|eukprot:XP_019856735.1 PREDICTED: uncharacterized protein LOC109585195 [Amphimedon queenslandica]